MTSTSLPAQDIPREGTQRVILQGFTWQTYQALLTELGDNRSSRREKASQ